MASTLEWSRRALLAGGGAAAIVATRSSRATPISQRPSSRVIVDNDFAGDPDGLVALAHQLLAATTRVVLVTSSALDPRLSAGLPSGRTALAGAEAATRLMTVVGLALRPPVHAGDETFQLGPSPAVAAIVAEAMRDDPLPLLLTCGGPLTNVAAALRLEPRIASRLTLIWIGGGGYPDGAREYNLMTDITAARAVLERSAVPVWQVPQPAYHQVQFSVAEMDEEFRTISPLTEWLHDRYTTLPAWVELGGSLTLGDSPLVLLSALTADGSRSRELPGRTILPDGAYGSALANRRIRVFEEIDRRLLLADMLATFRLHARR